VQDHEGRRTLQGLVRCGSAWSCPVCAASVYSHRADEIQHASELWRLAGGRVYLLTLTVRHALGDDLRLLAAGVAQAWRRLRQGRHGQSLWRQLGIVHTLRALEVTHGANGWHPHLHVLVFTRGAGFERWEEQLALEWCEAVRAELGCSAAPSHEQAATITHSEAAEYVAKLGLEVSSITKQGKRGSRTPWQVAHAAADHEPGARELWRDYGEAMRGRQSLTWSAHARRDLGLLRSDDELAVMLYEDRAGVEQVIATWSGAQWDRRTRVDRQYVSTVMRVADAGLELPSHLAPDQIPRPGIASPDHRTVPRPPRLPLAARRGEVEAPDLAAFERQMDERLAAQEAEGPTDWLRRCRALGKLRVKMAAILT
jgi:hypothetical protein